MEPHTRQLLNQAAFTFAKALTFMLTVLVVALSGLPRSAEATLLTLSLSGKFQDQGTDTRFNTFSGTYTYSENALDEDPHRQDVSDRGIGTPVEGAAIAVCPILGGQKRQ